MRDIVWFTAGDPAREPEARMAVRSMQQVPHRTVWLIGRKPAWVTGVEHVPYRVGEKWQDITDKWRLIPDLPVADEFYYWEDDYYVLEPVDEIPHYVLPWQFASRVGSTGWGMSHKNTLAILENVGFVDPPSFEAHVPLVVEKDRIPVHLDPGGVALRYRTMCGVHSSRPDVQIVRDVKVKNHAGFKDVLEKRVGFLSSTPHSFETSGIRRFLSDLFPNPSRYEVV